MLQPVRDVESGKHGPQPGVHSKGAISPDAAVESKAPYNLVPGAISPCEANPFQPAEADAYRPRVFRTVLSTTNPGNLITRYLSDALHFLEAGSIIAGIL